LNSPRRRPRRKSARRSQTTILLSRRGHGGETYADGAHHVPRTNSARPALRGRNTLSARVRANGKRIYAYTYVYHIREFALYCCWPSLGSDLIVLSRLVSDPRDVGSDTINARRIVPWRSPTRKKNKNGQCFRIPSTVYRFGFKTANSVSAGLLSICRSTAVLHEWRVVSLVRADFCRVSFAVHNENSVLTTRIYSNNVAQMPSDGHGRRNVIHARSTNSITVNEVSK